MEQQQQSQNYEPLPPSFTVQQPSVLAPQQEANVHGGGGSFMVPAKPHVLNSDGKNSSTTANTAAVGAAPAIPSTTTVITTTKTRPVPPKKIGLYFSPSTFQTNNSKDEDKDDVVVAPMTARKTEDEILGFIDLTNHLREQMTDNDFIDFDDTLICVYLDHCKRLEMLAQLVVPRLETRQKRMRKTIRKRMRKKEGHRVYCSPVTTP
ncbi:hypothetical protein BKA81DRAFT_402250 [Phyllosticta paracitricarpa]|uniref:Uncharacterized protein n=1 Tax=Phyllosticta paracitricarpa TaxID=2016321 RepID=A0ABR1MS31_9PEZI